MWRHTISNSAVRASIGEDRPRSTNFLFNFSFIGEKRERKTNLRTEMKKVPTEGMAGGMGGQTSSVPQFKTLNFAPLTVPEFDKLDYQTVWCNCFSITRSPSTICARKGIKWARKVPQQIVPFLLFAWTVRQYRFRGLQLRSPSTLCAGKV